MGTKRNPGRFDCHAKAEPHEPLFTLLARDPKAPALVERWALFAEEAGNVDEEKIREARDCAIAMRSYRGAVFDLGDLTRAMENRRKGVTERRGSNTIFERFNEVLPTATSSGSYLFERTTNTRKTKDERRDGIDRRDPDSRWTRYIVSPSPCRRNHGIGHRPRQGVDRRRVWGLPAVRQKPEPRLNGDRRYRRGVPDRRRQNL